MANGFLSNPDALIALGGALMNYGAPSLTPPRLDLAGPLQRVQQNQMQKQLLDQRLQEGQLQMAMQRRQKEAAQAKAQAVKQTQEAQAAFRQGAAQFGGNVQAFMQTPQGQQLFAQAYPDQFAKMASTTPKPTRPRVREAVDAQGNPVFISDEQALAGGYRPVPPRPGNPIRAIGPDGKPTFASAEQIAAGGYSPIPTGTQVSMTPEGGVSLTQGYIGTPEKTVRKGLQEGIIKDQETLDRGIGLIRRFDPDYFTYGGAGQAAFSNFMNKVDPNLRNQWAANRSGYMSELNQFFNEYRRYITGAAASEKEMEDIRRSIPNENDSPMNFQSKMVSLMSLTRKLMARRQQWLQTGQAGSFEDFAAENPLSEFPSMNERGQQIEQENPGMSPQEVLRVLMLEGYGGINAGGGLGN